LILAFSTDTCVIAVVLSLLVVMPKKYGTTDIRKLMKLDWREAIEDKEKSDNETSEDDA
jgi:hypothetical protein